MTPGVKKGIIAIAVTAIIAVLVIQFAVPPGGAQTVALNNLPSTMVLGKTYSFYVTINLQGITKIAYSSTITVSVFKSSGASVASAQFNGTGTIITTGGFVTGVVFHNGSATNILFFIPHLMQSHEGTVFNERCSEYQQHGTAHIFEACCFQSGLPGQPGSISDNIHYR
ncbi:MAG: hypothetical protein M1417_02565 [Candidatus Thermoplasmatota archaeon]|nr:hypothetical protein [Candidatus Thermoplasmatota archaeon]